MIVAGFGFTTRATCDSLVDALHQTGHADRIDLLATAADKLDLLRDLSQALGIPSTGLSHTDLATQTTATQSQAARDARQTGSVAEAAALAGAGPHAKLLVTRCISTDRMATCAIATGGPT